MKKNILIYIDWFYPGYKAGGPIQSIFNMVHALNTDFNFYIITSNVDFKTSKPYANIISESWIQQKYFSIYYRDLKQSQKKHRDIIKNIPFDIVYFNSFFSLHFTLIPLIVLKKIFTQKTIILAPRGMLSSASLRIKYLKKKIFIQMANIFGIYNNVIFHATDDTEKQDIKKIFNTHKIYTLSNIPQKGYFIEHIPKKKGELKLIFYARVHPKKNVIGAIKVLQTITESTISNIYFDIYGTMETPKYWEVCQKEIQKIANANIYVEYKGVIPPHNLKNIIQHYHVLFFPTLYENFGHSIIEIMSFGIPAIISTETPWKNLEQENAGWSIALNDIHTFKNAVISCVNMKQNEYDTMRKSTFTYIENTIDTQQIAQAYKTLFGV